MPDWVHVEPGVDGLLSLSGLLGALVVALLLLRALGTLLAGVLARVPGRLGSWGRAARSTLRPRLARRLTAGLLGLGVPTAALVAPAAAAPVSSRADEADEAAATPYASSRLAVRGSTGDAAVRAPAADRTYVVRHGDSLWEIARRHLPAGATARQAARAWPRWYAANRGVIGPDPSRIRPGMRLRVPGIPSTGTSTRQHHAPAPAVVPALSLDPDRR